MVFLLHFYKVLILSQSVKLTVSWEKLGIINIYVKVSCILMNLVLMRLLKIWVNMQRIQNIYLCIIKTVKPCLLSFVELYHMLHKSIQLLVKSMQEIPVQQTKLQNSLQKEDKKVVVLEQVIQSNQHQLHMVYLTLCRTYVVYNHQIHNGIYVSYVIKVQHIKKMVNFTVLNAHFKVDQISRISVIQSMYVKWVIVIKLYNCKKSWEVLV